MAVSPLYWILGLLVREGLGLNGGERVSGLVSGFFLLFQDISDQAY